MRTWLYCDYEEHSVVAVKEITDQEILDEYWDFWKGKMEKKYWVGHNLITEENCIEDWVTVNWAREKKDGE